jgi:hypothetical protein
MQDVSDSSTCGEQQHKKRRVSDDLMEEVGAQVKEWVCSEQSQGKKNSVEEVILMAAVVAVYMGLVGFAPNYDWLVQFVKQHDFSLRVCTQLEEESENSSGRSQARFGSKSRDQLKAWINIQYRMGQLPSVSAISDKAKSLADEAGVLNFEPSRSWVIHFVVHHIKLRLEDTVQLLPRDEQGVPTTNVMAPGLTSQGVPTTERTVPVPMTYTEIDPDGDKVERSCTLVSDRETKSGNNVIEEPPLFSTELDSDESSASNAEGM